MKLIRNWLVALFAPLVLMLGLTPAFAGVMTLPNATAAPPPTLTTTVDMDLSARNNLQVLAAPAAYYQLTVTGVAPPRSCITELSEANLNYSIDTVAAGLGTYDTADPAANTNLYNYNLLVLGSVAINNLNAGLGLPGANTVN